MPAHTDRGGRSDHEAILVACHEPLRVVVHLVVAHCSLDAFPLGQSHQTIAGSTTDLVRLAQNGLVAVSCPIRISCS